MTDMIKLRGDFIQFDSLLIVDIVNVQFTTFQDPSVHLHLAAILGVQL